MAVLYGEDCRRSKRLVAAQPLDYLPFFFFACAFASAALACSALNTRRCRAVRIASLSVPETVP